MNQDSSTNYNVTYYQNSEYKHNRYQSMKLFLKKQIRSALCQWQNTNPCSISTRKTKKEKLYQMGTEDSDESTATIVVWVRMEESVGANLRLGHEGSQEGWPVQLRVAKRGTVVVVVVVIATERSAMHWQCLGDNPIASSGGGSGSVFPSCAFELCLCCGAKDGERVRGQCGESA